MSSCGVIKGIFKAGFALGAFAVIFFFGIVAAIVVTLMRRS